MALALVVPAWRHFAPVQAELGWAYEVYRDCIERVSALAKGSQSELYVTQEYRNGKGTLLKLREDGSISQVMQGLSKPDGLLAYRGGIAISQEGMGNLPVLWMHGRRISTLLLGRSVEQLASDGRYLYAIEDRTSGRLLRLDPTTGRIDILRDGLNEAEAITACSNGQLFYTEKIHGWVKRLNTNGVDEVIWSGLNQPGFLLCDEHGLWVSEDATHMARLLLLDKTGAKHVILDHLRSPQTLLRLASGHYLLSEQGRNRILELNRS
ncbi:hypothetical protein [Azomonas macrocytogenes]|uniref:Uncharacterized protein n=1 Tax=Azomonas macrocytogenes TaxID=69962 RepID=A0A839TA31_AZOMA|nr:hypothetical protein [Azomonas macrocytogenes]MBB3105316.1 hypothetical protein [Azomonas macrocytogenes]